VLMNDVHSFENTGTQPLEFLVVGVAREKGRLDTVVETEAPRPR
jgi:mannose-6-phosphate isomerase-like protein (cupin superfamily)